LGTILGADVGADGGVGNVAMGVDGADALVAAEGAEPGAADATTVGTTAGAEFASDAKPADAPFARSANAGEAPTSVGAPPCRVGADLNANTPTAAAHTTAKLASPTFANVPDFSARASLSNSAMKRTTLGMRVLRSNDSAARNARHCLASRFGGRCGLKSELRAWVADRRSNGW
jgi:hypothetical protein